MNHRLIRRLLPPLMGALATLSGCAPEDSKLTAQPTDAGKTPPVATSHRDASVSFKDARPPDMQPLFGSDANIPVTNPDASDTPDAACAAVEQAAEALPGTAADIIWIIDNSGSMSEEAHFVQDNLNLFSRLISNGGVDPRVVLISAGSTGGTGGTGVCVRPPLGSGKCPDDTNYPRLFHVPETVNSNDELDKLMSTYPQWRGVLRKGVPKTFVVVTDDNSYTAAATFVSWVKTQAAFQGAQWRFSGIFCTNTLGTDCAAQGTVYNELVTTTSGVAGDLSKQDFGPVFQQLATSVVGDAVPVDCEWNIPAPPNGQKLNPDAVNVHFTQEDGTTETLYAVDKADECDDVHGGWYYDDPDAPTRVVACASSCRVMQSDRHAHVEVAFGCARRVRTKLQ